MAMDYSDTGQFQQLGKLALIWHQLRDLTRELTFNDGGSNTFHSLDTLLEEALGVFNATTEDRKLADRLNSDVRGWMQTVEDGWEEQLKTVTDQFLRDVIAPALDIPDTDPEDILRELALDMRANSETIDGHTTNAPTTATAASHNAATGVVRAYDLDREGDLHQLIRGQTIDIECTADAPNDGRTAGEETLRARGEPIDPSEGSGGEVSLDVAPATAASASHQTNRVDNGNFETFSANVPTDWAVENGTAGTHILEESTEKYVGSKCLELAGDGAQATIGISQDLSALSPELKPWTVYAINCWVKTSGVTAGDLAIKLSGQSTIEIFSIPSSWPTSWTAYGGFVVLPKNESTDYKIEIEVTGTPNSGSHFYIDNVALVEATTFEEAGIRLAAFQGHRDFVAGDKPDTWTVACTSDDAGRFQTFLRELYGVTLPFETDTSETIPDSLAE